MGCTTQTSSGPGSPKVGCLHQNNLDSFVFFWGELSLLKNPHHICELIEKKPKMAENGAEVSNVWFLSTKWFCYPMLTPFVCTLQVCPTWSSRCVASARDFVSSTSPRPRSPPKVWSYPSLPSPLSSIPVQYCQQRVSRDVFFCRISFQCSGNQSNDTHSSFFLIKLRLIEQTLRVCVRL